MTEATSFPKLGLMKKATFFFATMAMLLSVGFLNDAYLTRAQDPLDTTKKTPTVARAIKFIESAGKLGIIGSHAAVNSDGVMEYPFRASASVAAADLNSDGLVDVVSTNWTGETGVHIFLQGPLGSFTEQTANLLSDAASIDNTDQHTAGAITLDFNNDNFIDILVVRTGCISIYKNHRGKFFENVTDRFLQKPVCSGFTGANYTDINNDGFLDVYLHSASSNYTNPNGSGFNGLNGIRNVLLINQNGNSFTEQTDLFRIGNGNISWGSIFYYLMNERKLVLITINDFFNNRIFTKRAEDAVFFEKRLLPRDLVRGHMGGDVVYLENRMDAAIYITNATRAGFSTGFNLLYEWNPVTNQFENTAAKRGLTDCGFGWGAKFGDFDNDGSGDLISVNGYWNLGPKPYWYPYMTYGSGPLYLRGNIQSKTSIPTTVNTQLAGRQQNCLFLQHNGRFEDYAEMAGIDDLENGRGVALADLNNDGRLEILIGNVNHPPSVYMNLSDTPFKWIGFRLKSKRRNSFGIGSTIKIRTVSGWKRRDLFPANGFAGTNEPIIHFGLGNEEVLEAQLIWPDGEVVELKGLKENAYNTISD